MRRFSAPLAVLILGATIAGAEVTSGADSLSHTASSGSTKLAVNSDQGHNLQVAGSNIVEVTSSGVAVTGTLTQSNKAYVYGTVASALSLSSSFQDVTWSSATANGAMSWSNDKEFTPTNSGLYKVTAVVSAYLESAATTGERHFQLALQKSSTSGRIRAGISHLSREDSSSSTYSQAVIGPVVVSLTGGEAYKFVMRSVSNGDGRINTGTGTGLGDVYNSFLVESFP